MNDFSVHRIIGRGGFGEVYGCRKADTGKMYAMKCLDKKRIKMKQGETLALNERTMLSLVSTGVSDMIFKFTETEQKKKKYSNTHIPILTILIYGVSAYMNCNEIFG